MARPGRLEVAPSLEDAIKGADVIVIATPWPEFYSLAVGADQVVIDGWGMLEGDNVIPVGQG